MKKKQKKKREYDRVSGSGTNQVFKKKTKKQDRNNSKIDLREYR